MAEVTEREDKYNVDDDFVMPDFTDLAPAGGRLEQHVWQLESLYFDTDRHDLLCSGLTLRRRTGDTDAGWHLKLPAGAARTEMRLPLTASSDEIPQRWSEVTFGVRGNRPLHPVATVYTTRTARRLFDSAETLLVEISDDQVRAVPASESGTVQEWREIEAELGSGDEQLLASIGKRLGEAGARPMSGGNKLGRALGISAAEVADNSVQAYVAAQRAAILAGDLGFRTGNYDVHDTRVAARRLRAMLRSFKKLLAPDAARHLDAELAWYVDLLGGLRDPQVQHERLRRAAAELAPEEVRGPVAADVDEHLRSQQARSREALQQALNSERYLNLLDELAAWTRQPPLAVPSERLRKQVRAAHRRADRKASTRLHAALTPGAEAAELHRARKAAKRARYASELARPVLGKKKAKALIKHHKRLQDVLGQHHDSIVAAETLHTLGTQAAGTPGEGFTFGLLYERERGKAEAARAVAEEQGSSR
jgi:CHAD domain-containing protein